MHLHSCPARGAAKEGMRYKNVLIRNLSDSAQERVSSKQQQAKFRKLINTNIMNEAP